MLLQIVRQPSVDEMRSFLHRIAAQGMTREEARETKRDRSRKPERYVFRYAAKNQSYQVEVRFRKSNVAADDVEKALRDAINSLSNRRR
jgi:hypothetical protein